MSSISQFYILSPRGDTILSKEYRADVRKNSAEAFFRKVKFWKGGAPPVFDIDGINYLFIKRSGIFFVCTTKFNVAPSFILELLDRVAKVFKDYCGVLTEEAIRKNFILLYELLDEMIDYGFPQSTSTEALKMYVHNEPIAVAPVSTGGFLASKKTISSTAVQTPISLMGIGGGGRKNEIYVDILERLTVLFNSNGYVMNSSIDGSIQMKSYLSGNPGLRLALNEDLVVGKDSASGYGGQFVLDDCNFHECVNLDDFETGRTIALIPPQGEFVVMNYRITGEFRTPFRIFPMIEETSGYNVNLVLRVKAEIPEKNHGTDVVIRFPVPKNVATVTPEVANPGLSVSSMSSGVRGAASLASGLAAIPGNVHGITNQTAEYNSKDKEVVWTIAKFQGGSEHTLTTKITLSSPLGPSLRKELGPISMSFEIPMYHVSSLQVRYLRIAETHKNYKPMRWVRYLTSSESYVCRL